MKGIISLTMVLALCASALAADVPDMVGNWTGTSQGVGWDKNTSWQATGNFSYWEEEITLIIEEQNGTRFAGRAISVQQPIHREMIVGVIGSDNKTITMSDENGLIWGNILSPTRMEMFEQSADMQSMEAARGIFTKD